MKTPETPKPNVAKPVSELVRTSQVEVLREWLRDKPKKEIKRFRVKLR